MSDDDQTDDNWNYATPTPAIEVWLTTPTFRLGQIVGTPAALDALELAGKSAPEYLARHASRDWGELCEEDRKANDYAVDHGDRLLSQYEIDPHTKIWIITEWDRSVTTILLPSDY